MHLPAIIIASIIFSIMSMGVYTQSSLLLDIQVEKNEQLQLNELKKAILVKYETTGLIETDLAGLSEYTHLDFSTLKDSGKGDYYVITDGGSPFTYNGIGSYVAVVSTSYADGLNSSIDDGNFESRSSELFSLVASTELSNTSRGATLLKVSLCTAASNMFLTVEGALPNDVYDLVSGYYMDGKDALDEFGGVLRIDGSGVCYSTGVDKVDNGKSGDDVFY